MKRIHQSLFPILLFFQLGGSHLPAQSNKTADYVSAKLINPLEARIPQDLKNLLMENPRVTFRVEVGPDGSIRDAVAVEATHFGLLQVAEERILDAKFEPARLGDRPTVGKISVIITFYDPEQRAWQRGLAGAPQGGTVSDAVERRQYAANPDVYRYVESDPRELDEPLQIIETKLSLIHPPDQPAPTGKVLVEYYIDHEGDVHLPNILRSDDDYLTLSVLQTLKDTRFAPPKRDGQPALVMVRQPFNFD